MEIPVLNCNRVYINTNRVSLLVDNKKNYSITKDGWCILKLCDGTKNIDEIYNILKNEYDVEKEDIIFLLKKAERNSIIKFVSDIRKVNFVIYGGDNKIYPQSFAVELTNRCNLECIYCYGNYKRTTGVFLDMDIIVKTFESMKDNGVLTVELTGGEPLLHPYFKKILFLALKCFSRVNILSNGVLFDEDIFAIIKSDVDKVFVQISIDGSTEETNRKVRKVKNTWIKSLNTLRRLRDIGVKYRIVLYIIIEKYTR